MSCEDTRMYAMRADEDQIRKTIELGPKGGRATARPHHQPTISFHAKSKASGQRVLLALHLYQFLPQGSESFALAFGHSLFKQIPDGGYHFLDARHSGQ